MKVEGREGKVDRFLVGEGWGRAQVGPWEGGWSGDVFLRDGHPQGVGTGVLLEVGGGVGKVW